MAALEVGAFRIRMSSRRVLNRLLDYAGIDPALAKDVFRVLDKLEKIGPQKVRLELTSGYRDESGDPIRGLGLPEAAVDAIERFLAVRGASRVAVLGELRELFDEVSGAQEDIDSLERVSNHLYALGYGDDVVQVDLSIARGLAYYTGTVYETVLLDAPQYGSVCGGGRYDDLVMRYLGERVPAVGASIGVTRLMAALTELGRLPEAPAAARVLVATMDEGLQDEYLEMAFALRRAGVATELYLGGPVRLGKQIKHADQLGIPIVLIYGSNERERGVVTLKDMAPGKLLSATLDDRDAWRAERPGQREVPRDEVVEQVRALLAEMGAAPA
jgi:histidyl-tRNA synthetase